MTKAVLASLLTAFVLVGSAWAQGAIGGRSTISPPCAQARYGVDGTMGPVFCVIDNPLALRYYAKFGSHLFRLGPNASPAEVTQAGVADYKNSTEPILCETYRLAAWREQWQFPLSAAAAIGNTLHFPKSWCTDPSFSRRIDS